jgi:hypothetical protein
MLDLGLNRGRFILNNLESPVVTDSPRNAVKEWLKIQPRLTAEQIARLDPEPRKAGRFAPFSPKKKTKEYPPSYVRTAQLLRRMHRDGEIHRDRDHNNQPFVWMLPGTVYPQNFFTRSHELAVADLFVAYHPHVAHWDTEWGELETKALNIPRYRVHYDARMVLNDRVYLWEVDRGSMDFDQLSAKINKYCDFADSLGGEAFQVIFTLQKYRRLSLGNRADRLLEMLTRKKRRHMFLVAKQADVLTTPMGPVFVSPVDPMAKRLLSDLT